MHLKRVSDYDIILEWIPYNQLSNIKEFNKGDFATIYLAIWNDVLLHHNYNRYTDIQESQIKKWF